MSLNSMKTTDTSRKVIKDFKKAFGTGLILTNNEIKDIVKVFN